MVDHTQLLVHKAVRRDVVLIPFNQNVHGERQTGEEQCEGDEQRGDHETADQDDEGEGDDQQRRQRIQRHAVRPIAVGFAPSGGKNKQSKII